MSRGHSFEFIYDVIDPEYRVLVKYDFVPGVPARIRYDENDYPEEAPEIDINDMAIYCGDITWRSVSKVEFDVIRIFAMVNYFDEMVEAAS